MKKNQTLLLCLLAGAFTAHAQTGNIEFADTLVKKICIAHWDTDGDGELSHQEAAAVTTLADFFHHEKIQSFQELQYFTGLHTLNPGALSDNYQLTSVILPPSVETISAYAFWSCTVMPHIDIPSSVRQIQTACFYHCARLQDITIPSSITTIPDSTFTWCIDLQRATIEEGTETIGAYAFGYCPKLEYVTLPSTLRHIGSYAFCETASVRQFIVQAAQPPHIESTTFDPRIFQQAVLFVPESSLQAYKTAPIWRNFNYIVPLFSTF